MAYIPLNKIITNLYSDNNDLVYKSDSSIYTGFYYKTYTGKYFTGKTPNDPPNDELILIKELDLIDKEGKKQARIAYSDAPTPFNDINRKDYNSSLVFKYAGIIDTDLDNISSTFLNLPTQYYPTPTPDDYNLGSFTRYFCVKANENIYLEIDKDTYKALRGKFKSWYWQLYKSFSIPWTLTGNEAEVRKINYNISSLQEQRNKRTGFKLFLKYNYTKFYQPTDTIKNNTNPTSKEPSPTPSTPNLPNSSGGSY